MSIAFCRYLIQKKKLSVTHFLDCVETLRQEQASLPRLLYEGKILPIETMLQIFAYQAEHHTSFESACRHLGHWNESVEAQLLQIMEQRQTGIFRIIMQKQWMNCHELIASLDEFIGDKQGRKAA